MRHVDAVGEHEGRFVEEFEHAVGFDDANIGTSRNPTRYGPQAWLDEVGAAERDDHRQLLLEHCRNPVVAKVGVDEVILPGSCLSARLHYSAQQLPFRSSDVEEEDVKVDASASERFDLGCDENA